MAVRAWHNTGAEFCVYAQSIRLDIQKKTGDRLSEIYSRLGCSKYDLVHWKANPYVIENVCNNKKLYVIRSAADLFGLAALQSEGLANTAGLSLSPPTNHLQEILSTYRGRQRIICNMACVSERMFRHYVSGMIPTKQVLLAISITLNPSPPFINSLLKNCGYYLSKSLANDCIVLWHLKNRIDSRDHLLDSINGTLDKLGLPLLMTRQR